MKGEKYSCKLRLKEDWNQTFKKEVCFNLSMLYIKVDLQWLNVWTEMSKTWKSSRTLAARINFL